MIEENYNLQTKNTLGLPCEARFFSEIFSEEDLQQAIQIAKKNDLAMYILGLGSNILLPEKLDAVVIQLKNNQIQVLQNNVVELEGAALLMPTIITLAKQGFNLSSLTGFPSTIGGAVRGNAGLLGVSIGDFLEEAVIYNLETGEKEIWKQEDFQFDYRSSKLKTLKNKLFWSGKFKFPKSENALTEVSDLIKIRATKQPKGKSAGSFFKNPEGQAAGFLIDQCGLKGQQIGAAQISEQHANFFMNVGGASQQDFIDLIELAKNSVREKFSVELELEVEVVN